MAKLLFGKFGADYELWDADHDNGYELESTADNDTHRWHLGGTTPITDALTINQTSGFVWNSGGDSIPFQITGTTQTYMFYANTANDAIGFGTNVPYWTREGSVVPSPFLGTKKDLPTANAGAFFISSDFTARACDLTLGKTGGTWESPTRLLNNAVIANIRFEAHDGVDSNSVALIQAIINLKSQSDLMGHRRYLMGQSGDLEDHIKMEV